MTRLLAAAALCLALASPALAAENAQQNRMKDCNARAEGKKGEERKAFMSRCLKGEAEAPAGNSQQNKMKSCNEKAAGLKGEERKKLMSECLKG
jgi:opacity protein-like surface antigen